MEEIRGKRGAARAANKAPAKPPSRAPVKLEPMYATIGRSVPRDEGWSYEPKYDGVRVLAVVERGKVRLVTRNGKDKAAQFPEVVEALRSLASHGDLPLVLDGEVVALEKGSPARFQRLQSRMHLKDERVITGRRGQTPVSLIAFDLLRDGGAWLVGLPWSERREALESRVAADSTGALRISEVLRDTGERALRRARERGWEGVIAKRDSAVYRPGKRSEDWLKLKVEFRQEVVVGGWTEPQRTRPYLGSLLVGYYDGEDFLFAGGVGTGFDREGLRRMRERLTPLERPDPAFRNPPRTRTPVHWVRPELVVEVRFAEWTADRKLRSPVFVGVRDDKPAREVSREATSVQQR